MVIIALLFIYRKYKEEDEDLLGFKVIGYYLLGAFRFIEYYYYQIKVCTKLRL